MGRYYREQSAIHVHVGGFLGGYIQGVLLLRGCYYSTSMEGPLSAERVEGVALQPLSIAESMKSGRGAGSSVGAESVSLQIVHMPIITETCVIVSTDSLMYSVSVCGTVWDVTLESLEDAQPREPSVPEESDESSTEEEPTKGPG